MMPQYSRPEVEFLLSNYLVRHESFMDYWMDLVPALNQLDSKVKTVVYMHGVHDVPFTEIAELEGMTREGARKKYNRGIDQLLELMNGKA